MSIIVCRYGKQGLSWHILVFIRPYIDANGQLVRDMQVHVQVLDCDTKQDSTAVFALIHEALKIYKRANPEVTKAWLKSDNAGCYHSQFLLVPLWSIRDKIEGLRIMGYSFSAAGAGKDRCDSVSFLPLILTLS